MDFLPPGFQYDMKYYRNRNTNQADELRGWEAGEWMLNASNNITPIQISPEIFQDKSNDWIVENIEKEDLPFISFFAKVEPQKKNKIQEI